VVPSISAKPGYECSPRQQWVLVLKAIKNPLSSPFLLIMHISSSLLVYISSIQLPAYILLSLLFWALHVCCKNTISCTFRVLDGEDRFLTPLLGWLYNELDIRSHRENHARDRSHTYISHVLTKNSHNGLALLSSCAVFFSSRRCLPLVLDEYVLLAGAHSNLYVVTRVTWTAISLPEVLHTSMIIVSVQMFQTLI